MIAAPIILRRWFFSFEKPVELDASAQEFAPSDARCLPSSPDQLLAGVAHGVASVEDDLGQVEPQGIGCCMVYRRETQRLRASGPQQAVDLYVHRWQQPIRGVPAPRACGTLALGHALPSRSQTKQPAEVHNERELRRTALGDDLDHPTHRRETMAVKNYVESDTNPSQ